MAVTNEELFHRTLDTMVPGDTLMIMGGIFPGPNDSAEINLGMQQIMPMLLHVSGDFEKYPPRPNPINVDEDPITLTLFRNDARFGHDPGLLLAVGKNAGLILDRVVDLVTVGHHEFYFVGKPSPQ